MIPKIVMLILDGWGYAPSWGGNAIETASKPNMDNFWRKFPKTTLKAAEEAVGLPSHEPGNSEVGHLNLGSGQIVKQNLPGITATIKDGSFFSNEILLAAIDNAQKNKSNIHILGMVSDGGVHSHISHLYALLDLIKDKGFNRVYIHMISDGRDTDPMKALTFLESLEAKTKQIGFGRIETIMGRYYAMDRDRRWDRIQKAYDVLTTGAGLQAETPGKAIADSYRLGKYDEFIVPTAIVTPEAPYVPVNENDSLIFFNFRADRAAEITQAFLEPNLQEMRRKKLIKNLYFASFAYHEEYENRLPLKVVFKEKKNIVSLAEVLSTNNISQCHLAETEKYAHVTYFFDGGREKPLAKEQYFMIPSPKVATYDLKPEMSARKITDHFVKNMKSFDFWVINFANADMVGHTGNLQAAVKACEVVDECVGDVAKAVLADKRILIITADHGNAEQMINPNSGEPHTEHTTNPVPFIIVSEIPTLQNNLRVDSDELKLADVAPTILKILNIEVPPEMTGQSLVV